MRVQNQRVALGIACLSILLPIQVRAANFLKETTGIYAFGDSLTDTGNVLSQIGLPPFPYLDGRFTNGPNWLDYLSQSLNLYSPTPFLSGLPPSNGSNFAVGGATSGAVNVLNPPNLPLLPGLQQQIGAFVAPLQSANQQADSKALYILWTGANDYLPTDSQSFVPAKNPTSTISNLTSAIAALASVGAKNILTLNLPDLGSTPRVLALSREAPRSTR